MTPFKSRQDYLMPAMIIPRENLFTLNSGNYKRDIPEIFPLHNLLFWHLMLFDGLTGTSFSLPLRHRLAVINII